MVKSFRVRKAGLIDLDHAACIAFKARIVQIRHKVFEF
jgi:hypothetical protein